MVTRRAQQPTLHPQRRKGDTADGPWLCNTVAGCARQAVVQTTVACSGCEEVAAATAAAIDRKRAELEHHEQQERAVLTAARAEDRELADVERVVLTVAADKRQQIGADVLALEAASAAVVAEHTHPVFACDKHA